MRLLVCGDLHLKPAASDYDLDAIGVPDTVDMVLLLGDLTHRAGEDDIALAQRFVTRISQDVPIVYVPGNHDPAPTEQRVLESIAESYSGHRTVRNVNDVTIVGWGCEQRTLSLALDPCAFEALDPRDVPHEDRRYVADQVADDIEAAAHAVVCGDSTPAEVVSTLGITESEQAPFYDQYFTKRLDDPEQFVRGSAKW